MRILAKSDHQPNLDLDLDLARPRDQRQDNSHQPISTGQGNLPQGSRSGLVLSQHKLGRQLLAIAKGLKVGSKDIAGLFRRGRIITDMRR